MSGRPPGFPDAQALAGLGRFYRRHLLEAVMPFWEARTRDFEHGGYLTCFDRMGNLTNTDKFIWFQGRQLYLFSALYRQVEKRPLWLELARHGRDFIVGHAYAGAGRWNYRLNRAGAVREGTISIFTDHFVLQGLCEYALASGERADLPLIAETFGAIDRATRDPDFRDIFHGTWNPRYQRHGVFMMAVNTCAVAEPLMGVPRTRPLVDLALDRILRVFAKDEHRILLESVGRDGSFVDEPEGRVVNPGHALESTWFCLEEGLRRGDRGLVERSVEVADWAWARGRDPEFGGIFSYLDSRGGEPLRTDWHRETGMLWHDKAWWVHAEALYARALAALETGSAERFGQFLELHDWCQKHFYDPLYGEWYAELWRDGRPKNDHKGTLWKAAYHLPRALMKLALLFERVSGLQPAR